MGNRSKSRAADQRRRYTVETDWSSSDLAALEEMKQAEALLPTNAPRALLSVRLSVLTNDTTSPARQELDLRILARERGFRVVGVARDLHVSATKVSPWKRKELGHWLNDKAPEFDVLLFWKLDRFVRRLTDLSTMIDWCLKYEKNLVSKHDLIDLTTPAGKLTVTVICGIAEIEAANTSTRVSSLWDYNKTQSKWLVGKPAYGYMTDTDEDGKTVLVFDPNAHKALLWCRQAALRKEGGASARYMAKILIRSGLCAPGLTTTTLLRRLRNPALMGYRVEEDKESARRRSKLVLSSDGRPIRVAEPIFTEEEFETLQVAVDRRSNGSRHQRAAGETSHFIKVLVCADCGTSMTVHKTTTNGRSYEYLRCQKCPSGGLGAPNPHEVYDKLVADVLSALGDFPVHTREYAKAADAREEVKRLEGSVAYYMKELEPGGRFSRASFTREQAEGTLDKLIAELEAVAAESTTDRWVNIHNGRTFRQQWEEGGIRAMADDLRRVGVQCQMTRTKLPKNRAPKVHLRLLIPQDVRDRLVIRVDGFKSVRSGTADVRVTDVHDLLRQTQHGH